MDNRSSGANTKSEMTPVDRKVIPNNQQQNNMQQQRTQAVSPLKYINFELSEIYFPMFVIQINFDIFPLRNRNFKNNYTGFTNNDTSQQQQDQSIIQGFEDAGDDDYEINQEYLRQSYETSCKIFFILRDYFLLTRVQVTGTVVFYIKKEDKHFFGLDDSTGVITCVLWLKDNKAQGGNAGRREQEIRSWIVDNNVSIGTCLSVQAGLEHYKDKHQLNVYKMRLIADTNEEMLQYQQTVNAQNCFFDPYKPFQRRLFNKNWQQEQQQQQNQQTNVTMQNQQNQVKSGDDRKSSEVLEFSVKRIKKKINDFILSNYNELFFPKANDQNNEQIDEQTFTLTAQDILTNEALLKKATDELKYCEEKGKDPTELLRECLFELEEKGFFNLTGDAANQYLVQIRDQKKKLRHFISTLLQTNEKAMGFDKIYKEVSYKFNNFYTKEFVFKVIDELFQVGLIYEASKYTYAYLAQ